MRISLSPRRINFLAFIACVLILCISFYFERLKGMQPCLLCLLQRWALGLLGLLFLIAALHHPKKLGIRIYGLLTLLAASAGIAAAGRQVWLQHQPAHPDQTCLPGLNFLLQTHSLPEVIKLMFHGGRDCAEVTWHFLGLTMAEWTLVVFIIFAGVALLQVGRSRVIRREAA